MDIFVIHNLSLLYNNAAMNSTETRTFLKYFTKNAMANLFEIFLWPQCLIGNKGRLVKTYVTPALPVTTPPSMMVVVTMIITEKLSKQSKSQRMLDLQSQINLLNWRWMCLPGTTGTIRFWFY